MDELLDELMQGIEMRVSQLNREWEARKENPDSEDGREKRKETSARLNLIDRVLPETPSSDLDGLLLER